MAAPSITSLPEQTINTFVCKWNASSLPIQYTINNDKYPTGATVTDYYTSILIYINGSLVATLKQLPDPDNNTKINIKKYVQTALSYTASYTGLRDTNASCEFYITGSEEYLDASGTAQSNAITGGGSSVIHYASLSSLQFGSTYGGNMYNYVLNQNKQDLAQWMTFFERGQLVDNTDFLLSIIVDEPVFDLEVYQYNENGGWLFNQLIAVANNDVGVYRLNLDDVTFYSGVSYITVQALVSVYGTAVTELFTIDVDDTCVSVTTLPIPPPNWDISCSVFLQSFDLSSQDTAPTGSFFRSDGLKMYITGFTNDSIYEYDLSIAWDVSSATYLQLFDLSSQDANSGGIFFRSDGLKMYIAGGINDKIYEYDLSIAWDVTSSVFLQDFDITPKDSSLSDVFFKPDGLKMYVTGNLNDDVYEYDLSVAWDITTSVFLQSFDLSSQDTTTLGLFFKPDGLKMYTTGSVNNKVFEYELGTAWDVSTLSFYQNYDTSTQSLVPRSVFFKPTGGKMYVVGTGGKAIYEYNLDC